MKLLKVGADVGTLTSLEQPWASMMWRVPNFDDIGNNCHMNRIDYCCWGMPYRKRTGVACWGPSNFLASLAMTCPGNHQHIRLSNWGADKANAEDTKLRSAAYPAALCSAWADCILLATAGM
jgi:hypothetical protein